MDKPEEALRKDREWTNQIHRVLKQDAEWTNQRNRQY
jgi:hypothetical protein